MEVQQIEQAELPVMPETVSDNYEHEMAVKPTKAKAKKSRGRPKKKAAENDISLAESLPPPPEAAESAAKAKKKRGRPRKSEQADTKEESPKIEESLSANDASLSEESLRPGKKTKSEIKEIESQDELAEEDDKQPPSKSNIRESSVLDETDRNVLTKSISNMDDDATSKVPGATTTVEKEQKPEKPTVGSRSSTPSKGLSSIISKPVYRVGLSKRSRIAPLLKCLRKE
jgi:hypothetical protein